jgi:transcriptional repressor NrdR
MYCAKCGSLEDKVIDSRLSKDGRSIRRRRECLKCANRFTTYEEVERAELRVAKRDGRNEAFHKEKLLAGMIKACEKRPVSTEVLDGIAEDIQQALQLEFRREVPSHVIGAKVMAALHELDEVAYVRYASVYRHFQDIGEFIHEIQKLEKQPKKGGPQQELFK